MNRTLSIRFAVEDLQLFREASHDANPLHVSAEYSRQTAYGEPVVFGILGALASAGFLRERPNQALQEAELEFCNPLFAGITYRVEVKREAEDGATVLIHDGGRVMAKSRYGFRAQRGSSAKPAGSSKAGARGGPTVWRRPDLHPGIEIAGEYEVSVDPLEKLVARWGLASKGFTWDQLAALLWSSYFVGMELPGREAAFWKARFDFAPDPVSLGRMEYKTQLERLDERFDLLEMGAQLTTQGQSWAAAKLWAFLRPESPQCSVSKLQTLLPENQSLRGKVAVVVGGSRGLGAATALALALRGATVYAIYQHSEEQAKRLRTTAAGAPGEIMPVQGDAADAAWCQDLLAHINQRHEGLDILVCNACPSIQPLSFTPETLERVHRFVNESVAMVSVPMSVFLPALEKKAGWNIVVSTEAVRTMPTPWPHYVTAKCAVEGLVQWAARQFKSTKFLVLRPPKLLTDQMNTPSGRQGATPVEVVAAAVVSRVAAATSGSLVEVMETFDGHEKGSNDQVTKA